MLSDATTLNLLGCLARALPVCRLSMLPNQTLKLASARQSGPFGTVGVAWISERGREGGICSGGGGDGGGGVNS